MKRIDQYLTPTGFKVLATLMLFITSLTFALSSPSMIEASKFINHTAGELKKNSLAIDKIQEVVNGDCFQEEILKRPLIQTNGKTNKEVLDNLRSARIKIRLSMYRKRFSKVNGYTYGNSDVINLNRKYHDNYGICSVANNLAHEWSHKVGYSHDFKPSKQRAFSVPYSINELFDKCCKD